MKKNKFITSTIILMIGGFITKILGFIIKILYTRMVGEAGISLYSIVMPTYSLLITIASLALPTAISKLIAEEKRKTRNILISSTFIILFVNVILIVVTIASSKFIAYNLLQNKDAYYLILAMTLTLPFISISSVIKGYFFGKQQMMPNTVSNVAEQILRIALIILFVPKLMSVSVTLAVMFLILINIFSEFLSIIILTLYLPKHTKIKKADLKLDKSTMKDVFSISIPTVSSRFIGNIGLFLEPILLTNILLYLGYTNDFILREYGIYNAYAIALLILPAFFVTAICSALIPEISKYASLKKHDMVKRRFFQATKISFILGLVFSMIIFFFRTPLLQLVYGTSVGSDYIKVLAPFFVLFYLEAPFISTLQALGKSKETMKITFYGVVIKLISMVALSFLKIGIYGLIYSEIINIIFVVIANMRQIKTVLKQH